MIIFKKRLTAGYQTVTVSGMNGYICIQKQIRVRANSAMTVAIVNVQPDAIPTMVVEDRQ